MMDSVLMKLLQLFNGIVLDYLRAARKLVVVGPAFRGCQVGCDRVFLADGVMAHFAAGANAEVGLDMRAGRDFLQADLDGFGALGAFEGEGAWCF
jgi:hypothetical protein